MSLEILCCQASRWPWCTSEVLVYICQGTGDRARQGPLGRDPDDTFGYVAPPGSLGLGAESP